MAMNGWGTVALSSATTLPGTQPAVSTAALADRIFVRKVKQEIGREDLAAHFSRFGSVIDVYLPTVPGVSGHKGIAFITFSEASTVQLVMQYSPHSIQGCEVMVDVAAPRGEVPLVFGGQPVTAPPPPPAVLPPAALPLAAPPPVDTSESAGGQAGGAAGFSIDIVAQAEAQLAAMNGLAVAQQPQHSANAFLGATAPAASLATLLGGAQQVASSIGQVPGGYAPAVAGFPPPRPFASNVLYRQPVGVPVPGRIFVTKVPPNITRHDLQAYFAQFGRMTDCYLPANKGIAFVSYEDPDVAQRVLLNKEHFVRVGQAVFVEQAMDRGDAPPGVVAKGPQSGTIVPGRLFLTNVQSDVTRYDLQTYFAQFGNLSDCYTPNNGKGIAFVSYVDPKDAERVLQHREHVINSRGSTISVEQAVDRQPTGKGGPLPYQTAARPVQVAASPQLQAYSATVGGVTQQALGAVAVMADGAAAHSYGAAPATPSTTTAAAALASKQAQDLSALLNSVAQPAYSITAPAPAALPAQQSFGTMVGQQGFAAGVATAPQASLPQPVPALPLQGSMASGLPQVGAENRFQPY